MRRTAFMVTAAVCALAFMPGVGSATEQTTLVVDDDRAQCGQAAYTSIAAAVSAAAAGSVIQVCPGRYAERVVVDKPLTIRAQLEAVEAVDCFDPAPSAFGEAEAAHQAIIEPPDDADLPLVSLEADNVDLSGFVIQRFTDTEPTVVGPYTFYTPAVTTSAEHAGYRVHHNLVQLNTLGVEPGSSGTTQSRVDHNCLRANTWGLANQRHTLTNARVDHNQTSRHGILTFEIGWGYASMDSVTFDHNVALNDPIVYRVEKSTGIRILENTVEPRLRESTTTVHRAIWVLEGSNGIQVTGNTVTGGDAGIVFFPPASVDTPYANTGAVVSDNVVTGVRGVGGFGINLTSRSLTRSEISSNVLSDNRVAGLLVQGRNAYNSVRDNLVERNGSYGIRALAGSYGNELVANRMWGNGVDASDETDVVDDGFTVLLNTWTANECATDFPSGAICGVG